jgi:hypothetical protein
MIHRLSILRAVDTTGGLRSNREAFGVLFNESSQALLRVLTNSYRRVRNAFGRGAGDAVPLRMQHAC